MCWCDALWSHDDKCADDDGSCEPREDVAAIRLVAPSYDEADRAEWESFCCATECAQPRGAGAGDTQRTGFFRLVKLPKHPAVGGPPVYEVRDWDEVAVWKNATSAARIKRFWAPVHWSQTQVFAEVRRQRSLCDMWIRGLTESADVAGILKGVLVWYAALHDAVCKKLRDQLATGKGRRRLRDPVKAETFSGLRAQWQAQDVQHLCDCCERSAFGVHADVRADALQHSAVTFERVVACARELSESAAEEESGISAGVRAELGALHRAAEGQNPFWAFKQTMALKRSMDRLAAEASAKVERVRRLKQRLRWLEGEAEKRQRYLLEVGGV